jgi:hypothetical protein
MTFFRTDSDGENIIKNLYHSVSSYILPSSVYNNKKRPLIYAKVDSKGGTSKHIVTRTVSGRTNVCIIVMNMFTLPGNSSKIQNLYRQYCS